MSFGTTINTIISGDSGIAAIVGSGVFHHNYPDNYDITKSLVVFTYKLNEGISSLEEDNILEVYQLTVLCLSPETDTLDDLTTAVRACLDTYSSTNIRDVVFLGDSITLDALKERYMKSLEYRIIYEQ